MTIVLWMIPIIVNQWFLISIQYFTICSHFLWRRRHFLFCPHMFSSLIKTLPIEMPACLPICQTNEMKSVILYWSIVVFMQFNVCMNASRLSWTELPLVLEVCPSSIITFPLLSEVGSLSFALWHSPLSPVTILRSLEPRGRHCRMRLVDHRQSKSRPFNQSNQSIHLLLLASIFRNQQSCLHIQSLCCHGKGRE